MGRLAVRYKAFERKLYDKLHELRDEGSRPVNYKSLSLSATELVYIDNGNVTHVVLFGEVVQVEFVREEALFPCLDGPYLETKWLIQTSTARRVEIMDEAPHRKKLLAAFRGHLAGFEHAVAAAGLASAEEGRWLCFKAQSL